jgi:DNA-directed RNA polymerase subunit L
MNTDIPNQPYISMNNIIQNYNTLIHNDIPIKISFELHNIPLPLANSLRRTFSSRIPTITFDDTWYDDEEKRSIVIHKNTSGLHNEFLSHRLALLPINMNQESLTISTQFNKQSGKRIYQFKNEIIPIFELKQKNNILTKDRLDKSGSGMLNITTYHMNIRNFPSYNIEEFFKPDPYTNEHILINKLKSNFNNEDEGEELDIVCIPTIGYGWQNARYDPTGTVTFGFQTDETRVDDIFQQKLDYMNNERINKKLDTYSEEEVKQLRNSFNLLDKERVFKKNETGEPTIFEISIETIGFMRPTQILLSGLHILKLLLGDIKNSLEIAAIPDELTFNTNSKLTFIKSPTYEHGWAIRIFDEDHTLGNLIGKYARSLFNKTDDDLMKFISYKMEHPLINNIDIIIVPKLIRNNYIEWIRNKYFSTNINDTFTKLNINFDFINKLTDESLYQLVCVIVFINTINTILNDINKLIEDTITITKEIDPIFEINDPTDYTNIYNDL